MVDLDDPPCGVVGLHRRDASGAKGRVAIEVRGAGQVRLIGPDREAPLVIDHEPAGDPLLGGLEGLCLQRPREAIKVVDAGGRAGSWDKVALAIVAEALAA